MPIKAGRPKGSKNKKKVETSKYRQIKCECEDHEGKNPISETNFYTSKSPLFPDGKVHMCKKCLNKMIDFNDMTTIYRVLQILDVAFFYDVWNKVYNDNIDKEDKILGLYIKEINLGQFFNKRYSDSIFEKPKEEIEKENLENIKKSNKKKNKKTVDDILDEFEVTIDMIMKWGTNYEKKEYFQLENLYNNIYSKNSDIIGDNPQAIDNLKKICIISMKMNEELSNCNYGEAKKLSEMYSKLLADGKLRTADKKEEDNTGGIRNICTIVAEVGKDDFIPPWEHYRKIKGLSQDILDKTIMYILNFTLKLNKIEKMTDPPIDTPKAEYDEIDGDA